MIISINFESDVPIYIQLKDAIVQGIASGALKTNEQLPSVRKMAKDIGIHAHTVNKSYSSLKDDGYIIMDRRSGCFVKENKTTEAEFISNLTIKMTTLCAEAICHKVSLNEFLQLCERSYLEIENNKGELE